MTRSHNVGMSEKNFIGGSCRCCGSCFYFALFDKRHSESDGLGLDDKDEFSVHDFTTD
jgi:hypothetical protein